MTATLEAVKTTKNAQYRVVAEEVEGPPGRWNLCVLRIFLITTSEQKQIGEYTRNYPAFAVETFLPFSRGDRDYALYSRDYTSTRVMELPSCRDIGGEEPNAAGFCPMAYCVPEILTSGKDPGDGIAGVLRDRVVDAVCIGHVGELTGASYGYSKRRFACWHCGRCRRSQDSGAGVDGVHRNRAVILVRCIGKFAGRVDGHRERATPLRRQRASSASKLLCLS